VGQELLEELTLAVREELLEAPVSSVSTVTVQAPDGARAVDGTAVGELVVVLTSSAAAARAVVRVLRAWRDRRPARTVDLRVGKHTLKLRDATPEQQDRVVEAFIAAICKD
jgi:hypothetical protein